MIAKVIKTGEIIYDVVEYISEPDYYSMHIRGRNEEGKFCDYVARDVLVLPSHKQKSIDWEQRRYEIAKTVLPNAPYFGDKAVEYAIEQADKLIKKLKETKYEQSSKTRTDR